MVKIDEFVEGYKREDVQNAERFDKFGGKYYLVFIFYSTLLSNGVKLYRVTIRFNLFLRMACQVITAL